MYFTDIREHAIPLFIDADILPVTFMYYKTVASLMHDIRQQTTRIRQQISSIYLKKPQQFIHTIQNHLLRITFTLKAQSWKYTKTPYFILV